MPVSGSYSRIDTTHEGTNMKGREGSALKSQATKLIAADAPNYQVNFSCSVLFAILGAAAEYTKSPVLSTLSFMFATGTALVGLRQWSAARFFPQPSAVQSEKQEKYHDAAEVSGVRKKTE